MAENPYDEAVRRMTGTIANSRFTGTPIMIAPTSTDTEATGRYQYPPRNQIIIRTAKDWPDFGEFNRVLHHEDIHALFKQAGLNNPSINYDFNNIVKNIKDAKLRKSIFTTVRDFIESDRQGMPDIELPAYTGSFEQGKIPGLTAERAQDYSGAVKRVLPQPTADIYQRIVDNIRLANPLWQSNK